MKIAIVLFALLAVSFVASESNYYKCGNSNSCDRYWTCWIDGPQEGCQQKCDDRVLLTQTIRNSWVDKNGQNYVQIDATLKNVGPRPIKNVIIDAAELDIIGTQIWSVDRLPNSDIILPSYQLILNPSQIHNFGYIAKGNGPAHLWVKKVIVA